MENVINKLRKRLMAGEPILIVEDNQINLMLLKTLLSFKGYDAHTASNAEEALQVLDTFSPKLILMDIQLPGMDGLELTRKLRENPKFKNTLIVAVTAYAMKGDKEKALEAGCNGYIAKPIDSKSFTDIVAEYISHA